VFELYERIITHDDFDGIVSASICSHVFDVDHFRFAGPRTIAESRFPITDEDIVCDLPYPLNCGLWFDHHQGNADELQYRGIEINQIEGKFAPDPSCSRVVYDYFTENQMLPVHFKEMVREADVIDSFAYTSIDDWRQETPGKIIEGTLKLRLGETRDRWDYMGRLVLQLREASLEKVAGLLEVKDRYHQFQAEEEKMIDQIRQDARFLAEDPNQTLIVIDLTRHNREPRMVKNLSFLLFPEAEAVIEVKNRFRRDIKTTDLTFSMSLSLNLNEKKQSKDVGEIMRLLNMGDGHPGAGAGVVNCASKDDMLRKKEDILKQVYQIWSEQ